MDNIAFIGGGNMATAIIGGLLKTGRAGTSIIVVEPGAEQRQRLQQQFGVTVLAAPDAALAGAALVVWAVKPQVFAEAAVPVEPFLGQALQLSIMAGIRSGAIATATGSERVVRAMPNTPALIGLGVSGLYARPAVGDAGRRLVETVLAATGQSLWVEREEDLDAVTAISGSGPAYVFYFIEAMVAAAARMGLTPEQGRTLALATFAGATALAQQSTDDVATLREKVTSKGGTTYAALTSMQADQLGPLFEKALEAARARAQELGDEFGRR